jgi:hypothetical protein
MSYVRTETVKTGAARIGRSGKKLHPASIIRIIFDDRIVENQIQLGCSCTGTANGHAQHKAQFFENVKPTCREEKQNEHRTSV